MTLTTDKVHEGMDIIDLLLTNTDETTSCYANQPSWTIDDDLSPERNDTDNFLGALLHGSNCSSSPGSPLWSPCTTDSGINDDPLMDPESSSHASSYTACPDIDLEAFTQPQQSPGNDSQINEKRPDVCINLDWDSATLPKESEIAYYLTTNQNPQLAPNNTLTVKDLLLSNLGQRRIPQHALEELVLNEDEKKLLAKEGVNLPSKLPLSKFEERVLKKIRRKIRNKRSAQESRKKKREYVDSLEVRMSACSAHNLELQRKIHQLQETNTALLEKLSQLQALPPNGSSKTTHRGSCILVLLLSFSLIISSNLHPDPQSQLRQTDYTDIKVSSRSLQSVDEAQDVPPPPHRPPPLCHSSLPALYLSKGFEALRSLTEKLRPWTDLPSAGFSSVPHQDHRHLDDH